SYNVGPTRMAPVYVYNFNKNEKHNLQYMKWGLVPMWARKEAMIKQFDFKYFNARCESIESGKLWATVRNTKRCVVPVQGYYEWLHDAKTKEKIPYYVKRKDDKLIFLAGFYESVSYTSLSNNGKIVLNSFTIITQPAFKELSWLHKRMPVILKENSNDFDKWIDNKTNDTWSDSLKICLNSSRDIKLEWFKVSKNVGKMANDGKYLIEPIKSR
ncbi:putative peptide hydrolase, partial [Ascoidea rubescens DSM 1968]